MINNVILGQDPLLYTTTIPQRPQDADIKKQLDSVMSQYQALQAQQQTTPPVQQTAPVKDYIGILDQTIRDAGEDVLKSLGENEEFKQLNEGIQQMIQMEIMRDARSRINSNPEAVKYIDRLMNIINDAKRNKEEENNRNLAELNDYIRNYSDLTFNEYKQLKYGK